MYSYGPPHMAVQKQDDQHEHTFSSYVRIRDVFLKTYLRRWTIRRSGERGSGISVLPVMLGYFSRSLLGKTQTMPPVGSVGMFFCAHALKSLNNVQRTQQRIMYATFYGKTPHNDCLLLQSHQWKWWIKYHNFLRQAIFLCLIHSPPSPPKTF